MKIIFTSLIFLCGFFAHVLLFAQQSVSLDSLRQKGKVRLQLPDEIIYGEIKAKRVVTREKESTDSKIHLLTPSYKIQNFTQKKNIEKSTFQLTQNSHSRKVEADIHGGNFGELGAGVTYSQQLQKFNYQVSARHRNFSGHYENSLQQKYLIGTFISSPLTENIHLSAKIDHANQKYGLFQSYNSNSSKRKHHSTLAAIFLNYQEPGEQSVLGNIEFIGNRFADSKTDSGQLKDDWFSFNLSYQRDLKKSSLLAGAKYRHNEFGDQQSQSEILVQAAWRYQMTNHWSMFAGINYQNVAVSQLNSSRKFSPDFQVIYSPSWNFRSKLSISSGIIPLQFSKLAAYNPFLSLQEKLIPVNQEFKSELIFDLMPLEKYQFSAKFSFVKRVNDFYYFKNSDGLFELHRFHRANRLQFKLTGKANFAANLSASASVNLNFFSVKDDSLNGKSVHFPYQERLNVPLVLTWKLSEGFIVNFNAVYISPRFKGIMGEEKLSDFVLANLQLDKALTRNILIFLKSENLFNQPVVFWEGFPVSGISFTVGVKSTW